MWTDETVGDRWSLNIDAYRKDYRDKKPEWKDDSETLRREEMKRRHELEELMQRVAAHQVATRSKASRTTVLAKRDGDTAGISYAAISRVGGGAAVGTTLGTAITPGLGTIAGAILGGVVGAFAPSVLSHKKSSRRRKGRAITRSR